MYHDPMLQKTVAANSNLHQVILSEVKKEQSQTHELTIHDLVISLSPLGFIIGWIGFFIIWRKVQTFFDDKMVFSINGLQKVPCKKCRFYSKNHYLKCAVNPCIVLTEEAMNCSEYSPSNKNKSSNYSSFERF